MTDSQFPKPLGSESNPDPKPAEYAQAAINRGAQKDHSTDAAAPGWERTILENLAMAVVTEQRQARRWRNGIRLAWLLFLVGLAWIGMDRSPATPDGSNPHTAVVKIEGEIASGAEASAELIISAMRSAFEDKGSLAVVLLINSPGGSPVQAGIINDEINRLKALHRKPVYAVVEETCASAAYYIAAAADKRNA